MLSSATLDPNSFVMQVPSGDAIDIQVNEPDEATDVDIYIKAGSRPNFFNFDAMNSTLESLTVLEIPEKQVRGRDASTKYHDFL